MKTKNICAGLLTGIMLLGSSMVSAAPLGTFAGSNVEVVQTANFWETVGNTVVERVIDNVLGGGNYRYPGHYAPPPPPPRPHFGPHHGWGPHHGHHHSGPRHHHRR